MLKKHKMVKIKTKIVKVNSMRLLLQTFMSIGQSFIGIPYKIYTPGSSQCHGLSPE